MILLATLENGTSIVDLYLLVVTMVVITCRTHNQLYYNCMTRKICFLLLNCTSIEDQTLGATH